MDATRAQEILKTERTIDVKHDGVPVWIESVDMSSSMATVHVKNNTSSKKQVPVQELSEV